MDGSQHEHVQGGKMQRGEGCTVRRAGATWPLSKPLCSCWDHPPALSLSLSPRPPLSLARCPLRRARSFALRPPSAEAASFLSFPNPRIIVVLRCLASPLHLRSPSPPHPRIPPPPRGTRGAQCPAPPSPASRDALQSRCPARAPIAPACPLGPPLSPWTSPAAPALRSPHPAPFPAPASLPLTARWHFLWRSWPRNRTLPTRNWCHPHFQTSDMQRGGLGWHTR